MSSVRRDTMDVGKVIRGIACTVSQPRLPKLYRETGWGEQLAMVS